MPRSLKIGCVFGLLAFLSIVSQGTVYGASPNLTLWPASGVTGNPGFVLLKVDNGQTSLGQLNLGTFSVKFDNLEVGPSLLSLPYRYYVIDGNTAGIWLGPFLLPAGAHELAFRLGNTGLGVQATTNSWNIQANQNLFLFGFHAPPFEDWVAPHDDWARFISQFNQSAGRNHTIIGYFTSWADGSGNYTEFNDFLNPQIVSLGAIPQITWEPWRAGGGPNQADYSLTAIAGGNHDVYIVRFAQACRAFGYPLILRMMHEFNGAYYPWSGPNNGDNPQLFVDAFRHVVNLFRQEGANNVLFMWSPNYTSDARVTGASRNIENFYPGDDVVDYIGVSGYNWGSDTTMQAQGWLDFNGLFDNPLFGSFLSSMENNHPNKQVIIAEIGCNEDSPNRKANWIRNAYQEMFRRGNVIGAVWFNNKAFHDAAQKQSDFRLIPNHGDLDSPSPASLEAYKEVIQNP